MKNIYLIVALLLILFSGCSSTYKVTDFPTKEKFYEEFNDTFKDREAKVILVNDSSFIAQNGVEIKNDTLFSFMNLEQKQNRQFALSEVNDIEFMGSTITSASIILKNGDKLKGYEVRITKDSINFIETKNLVLLNKLESIDKIKQINYKNRWKRMPLGVIAGAPLGLLSGITLGNVLKTKDAEGNPYVFSMVLQLTAVGVLTGCITSYLIGFDYIYEFNP